MTEHIYYRTNFPSIAKGVVLKDHDYVESTGAEGILVECVGVAPFDQQPYEEGERIGGNNIYSMQAEEYHQMQEEDLSNLGDDGLHIVHPDDVVKRMEECEGVEQ